MKRLLIIVLLMGMIVGLSACADSESEESSDKEQETKVEDAGFAEIYTSFQENELVAKEKYNGKKYKIRARINGMETGGLLNLTGGATLTMEDQVGNTIVFFYAEFEKNKRKS